ncbi:hypothetical protein [Nocardia sp. alder85J]|uniref:hypothetical protein n=1 Tax=Nocardia sp. alder85J TaxID=2862949 RepID=UPI001CD4CBD6|nr:hypothetical protein [Nocardia sp. alder85J]MCX4099083.1 hypothetical protein [Nocardia sp. alder85J]
MVLSSPPSIDQVKECLIKLRQGPALARPTTLLTALDTPVRDYLCHGRPHIPGSADQVALLDATIRSAIGLLSDTERQFAEVDFNLVNDHRFPTLTERQESLASHQKCAAKTVRRHAARALDTLAYLLIASGTTETKLLPAGQEPAESRPEPASGPENLADTLRAFWRLSPNAKVDIVCSEIPADERPDYASPADRNYLRYAKFADLDTLIYIRTRLAQLAPTVVVRDFAPSEHYDTHADVLVVIGGPPWNAKYREFLPQLPFHFEPHPLGEDDPLVVPALDGLSLAPRWTSRGELIEDLTVLTRLTVQGTTVFLLGGCLTLGVLGAARCLMDADRGPANATYLTDRLGDNDFVLVTEVRRVGGITDVADLTMIEPLLVITRSAGEGWGVVTDNTKRFANRQHTGS